MIIQQLRRHFSTLIHEIHTLSTIFIDFNLIPKFLKTTTTINFYELQLDINEG